MNRYKATQEWLDTLLGDGQLHSNVVAIGFNLYDKGQDSWTMEMVGTGRFSLDDDSWLSDEIMDFGTRQYPLIWEQASDWKTILAEAVLNLKEYLDHGKHAHCLKTVAGVGVGFADGDIEILYTSPQRESR